MSDSPSLPAQAPPPCTSQTRAAQWSACVRTQGLSGEYAIAAALKQPSYDEEQAHMLANLFGR